MDEEARFGPRGIWKGDEGDDGGGEAASEDDIYDNVERDSEEFEEEGEDGHDEREEEADVVDRGEEEGEEDEEEGQEEEGAEEEESISRANSNGKTSKRIHRDGGGDFKRVGNGERSIGLVFQSDLVRLGKVSADDGSAVEGSRLSEEEEEEEGDHSKGAAAAAVKKVDIDELALRRYELQKLKYYFAIVECDSGETANFLFNELDNVELEHSSMVLDLSFVPDELSFDDREVRDRAVAGSVGDYKAPSFVVEALQHTKVHCTWDEGDKDRERKLTNISRWRELNESELQQYIASTDSSDSEPDMDLAQLNQRLQRTGRGGGEGRGGEGGGEVKIANGKKAKAEKIRRQLLGLGAESDMDSDEPHGRSERAKDDFFCSDREDEGEEGDPATSANGSEVDDTVMEYTYMPERDSDDDEEKKPRAKGRNGKARNGEGAKEKPSKADKKGGKQKNGRIHAEDEEDNETKSKRQAQLELLFDNNLEENADERDFNMRDLVKLQKKTGGEDQSQSKKKKKKLRKKSKGEDAVENSDFQLNLEDERFKALFEDAKYGIDLTNPDFKQTSLMNELLSEQTKRKKVLAKRKRDHVDNVAVLANSESVLDDNVNSKIDVARLVSKLKTKLK